VFGLTSPQGRLPFDTADPLFRFGDWTGFRG